LAFLFESLDIFFIKQRRDKMKLPESKVSDDKIKESEHVVMDDG